MKISLIIPVFNVDQYLSRCLDSCIHQDLIPDEYEIIAVNDGSTDRSLTILREYEQKYSNIKVIDKPNGGLSSARNTGLSVAIGDYIWFIDSDDWIKENSLCKIYELLKHFDVEVLAFNIFISSDEIIDICGNERSLESGFIFNGITLYEKGYIYPFSGAQFYIYNHDFLTNHKMTFLEGVVFEDLLFTAKIFTILERCFFTSDSFYYYYIRQGSITKSKPTPKKLQDLIKISQSLFALLPYTRKHQKVIIYSIVAKISKAFYNQWKDIEYIERKKSRNQFLTMNLWLISTLKSRQFKYVLFYLLIKLNFRINIKSHVK